MKTLRTLLALAFATALAGSVAFAEVGDKKGDVKAEKAPCGCVVGKDKKVCGVDKDCCCTGEKAKSKGKEKAAEKKAEKKADAKACCTDAACVAVKGDKAKGKADCTGCTTCK